MSALWIKPIAILFSDLHLTMVRPACRLDTDWMTTQADYLNQVKEIAGKTPILCSGDLFDRWNASPELIHFALKHLPDKMISVPGQHDLPNHQIEKMHRSGYGVLKEAGKIIDVAGTTLETDDFIVRGFGWEQPVTPVSGKINDRRTNIALIHEYCWTEGKSYPDAPGTNHATKFEKKLQGHDVAVFGDNHQHFSLTVGGCTVWNCGGFIRRRSDEVFRLPCVGILMSNGSIQRQKLDTSNDRFCEIETEKLETPFNLKDFVSGLEELAEHGLDFRQAVENHLRTEDLHPRAKEYILQALDAK